MERHRLTADQAFHVLVHASTRTNRKLIEVAEELTTTGVAAGTSLRTAGRAAVAAAGQAAPA
jgi:hypothetical protein